MKIGGNRFYWKPLFYLVYIYLKTVNFTIYKKVVLRNVYETTVAVPENYSLSENLIYTPPIRSSPHYTLKNRQILYPCTNNCLQFIEWIFHANVIQANTSYIAHEQYLIIKQLYRNISIIESFASDHRRNWSSIYRHFT